MYLKKIRNVTLIVFACLAIGFIGFIYQSNPITLYGSSIYKDSNGNNEIVFDFYNEGILKVKIKEVLIPNQSSNQLVDLGISYDNSHAVQSNTDNELIKFYPFGEKFVLTKKSRDEIADAHERKQMTPMSYGIRVNNFKEPMEYITIKYTYFGIPVSKDIQVTHLIPPNY